MTFGEIYRDIYSTLNLDGENHDIYFGDISNAINDSIREIRVEYISQGNAGFFAETENLSSFTQDSNYPFLYIDTLTNEIEEDLPEYQTVIGSVAYNTSNTITNTTQSFNAGDIARKDRDLFKCVETFSNKNTYNLTFDPKDVGFIHQGNGVKYDSGDIVYDKSNGKYYKVNTGFTNDSGSVISSLSELDLLHWRKIGKANIRTSHYKFENIKTLEIFEDSFETEAFVVHKNTVYVTPDIKELVISYIPEWADIEDFDVNLDLPDFMISFVKEKALAKVARKLNIEVQQFLNTEQDGEE